MTRAIRSYLDRFPLISTHHLASAREATAKFWPKHTSDVLGPEDYALQMNRVLLGSLAVSYVVCTSRIRVIPASQATTRPSTCRSRGASTSCRTVLI